MAFRRPSPRSRPPLGQSLRAFLARWTQPGGAPSTQAEATDRDVSRAEAQKMEALGRLTGGVAHDFNNLLTVVLGNATALRIQAESRGDTQAIRRAEMIERAAERGGRVAGQLLAFSRKQMLRPEIVSAYQVLSATHELFAQAAGEGARVLIQSEPGLWRCLVDPGQLESAVLNLVLNARDAMPVGGDIVISCHNIHVGRLQAPASPRKAGDYVRIDVKDNGSGIPVEIRDKVFEPFFTTKPIGQGSGLGLAQVHGFAGQSGGWVELESTIGRGTTISLFLPSTKDARLEAPQRAGESLSERSAPAGGNRTVLVVEPEADLRSTTCETLNRSGFRAVGVANGSGAIACLASEQPFDALLTEARLPGGVSGLVLARSARQVRPGLCVVVTSSSTEDVARGAANGSPGGDAGFEFVVKPYRAPDLVRVVGAALSSMTYSVETEELMAEAKLSGARSGRAARPAPDAARPAGLRTNAIRLGVMPFRSIAPGGDAAFTHGLAEEITAAFSRFRWITCVGSSSVAALANEPAGSTERWQQLDLDYLIEGSFRIKGNRITVLLRLEHMRGTGGISWGQRFDGLLPEILDLQDRIASAAAAQLGPEILVWEGLEAMSRRRVDPTAYEIMLRAIPGFYRLEEAAYRESGQLFEQSLALDPNNPACLSWLAHWNLFLLGQGWAAEPDLVRQRADDLSKRAVLLDPGDARGFTVAGHVRAFLNRDAAGALGLHERAIALNPNMALAWCYSGLAYCYLGDHAEAVRRIEHAKRLSPHDPHLFFFDTALALPLLLSGRYEASAAVGRLGSAREPGLSATYKSLLAALGHLGAAREAAAVRKSLLALEPDFSVGSAAARSPLTRTDDLACYVQGLRLAGIPERSRLAMTHH